MKIIGIALVIALSLVVAGCTPLERTAYNTVVGAKAFLDSEKKAHPECAFPLSGASPNVTITWCSKINRGIGSKDLLIDAIEVYCAGPDFATGTGACNAPAKGTAAATQAAAKLQAAIDAYKQVAADLKAVQ